MTGDQLTIRLRTGEDSRTEFKSVEQGFPSTEVIAKELSAFANSGGGDLLLGVEDDGRVTGIGTTKEAERLQHHVVQASRNLSPPLRLSAVIVVERDGKLVVVARVPGFQPGRPFRGQSKYFVRDGPESREMRPDELKRVAASALDTHLDEQPLEGTTRDDFDPETVDAVVRRITSRADANGDRALRALHLVDADGVPTVAGVLLLGKAPQEHVLDAYVTIVRIDGTTIGGAVLDRKDLQSRVQDQIEGAVSYLARLTPEPVVLDGARRRATGVPAQVWREAVTNAVVHRDYQVASQTRIFVLDDRVEIANPGVLLNHLSIDGIRLGGVSQRRNPYLAAVLQRLQYGESVGLGVPAMFRLLADAGLAEPTITVANGEFRLIVRTRSPGAPNGG